MGYLHMKQTTLPWGGVYPLNVGSIHLFANLGERVDAEAPDMFKFSHRGQLELRDRRVWGEVCYVKLCQLGMKTVVFHRSR